MVFLVVDDEASLASLLRETLEASGAICHWAADVAAAEELLDSAAVDALALDLGLPGPSALPWFFRRCEDDPGFARRTVIMTGRELDDGDAEKLRATGAEVLFKPFRLAEFRRTMVGRATDRT